MALEDAQRTMGLLVRLHAAEWHIDPHKIGVLGFSSGGHLSAAISAHFVKRLYAAVDAVDQESCPRFAVATYPGNLLLSAPEWDARQGTKKFVFESRSMGRWPIKQFGLNPDTPVTRQTPPTFLLQAEDNLNPQSNPQFHCTAPDGMPRAFRNSLARPVFHRCLPVEPLRSQVLAEPLFQLCAVGN